LNFCVGDVVLFEVGIDGKGFIAGVMRMFFWVEGIVKRRGIGKLRERIENEKSNDEVSYEYE
jgi:hypothetical protein